MRTLKSAPLLQQAEGCRRLGEVALGEGVTELKPAAVKVGIADEKSGRLVRP